MGTNNTTPNAGAGPSSKRPPPAAGGPKDGKTAAVKVSAFKYISLFVSKY